MLTINTIISYTIIIMVCFSLARFLHKILKRVFQDLQLKTVSKLVPIIIENSIYIITVSYIIIDLGIHNVVFNIILWFILTLILINTITFLYNNIPNLLHRPKLKIGKQKWTHVEIKHSKTEKILVPNRIIGSTFPIEKLNPKSQPES
jgi:hypothetical protein